MRKPIWMSDIDWMQMSELKKEWDSLMTHHRELRGHLQNPEDVARLQSINSRIRDIDKKVRIINNRNPMLVPNILPHLKLEKVWQSFWELRDQLLDADRLTSKERFHVLCEALNLGDELIRGGHERKDEIKPLMQYLLQQLIYGVHFTVQHEMLSLEISNVFGDQLIEPIHHPKQGLSSLPDFLEKIRTIKPTKLAALNFEGKTTTNWDDVVGWLQEKLFAS